MGVGEGVARNRGAGSVGEGSLERVEGDGEGGGSKGESALDGWRGRRVGVVRWSEGVGVVG